MNPSFDNLRNARDFLSHLLDLPPKEAIDLLSNEGEEMVADFNEALGKEAFKVGDKVLANPDAQSFEQFAGTVIGLRESKMGWLFSIKDQEDNVFDCEAGELVPCQD